LVLLRGLELHSDDRHMMGEPRALPRSAESLGETRANGEEFARVIGIPVWSPEGWRERLRSALGFARPTSDRGVFLPDAAGVCLLFAPYPVDIIAPDASGEVVGFALGVMPWGLLAFRPPAQHLVLVPAGFIASRGLQIGHGVGVVPEGWRCEFSAEWDGDWPESSDDPGP
jgi:hypothetical protein